jgi:hypothetical protein
MKAFLAVGLLSVSYIIFAGAKYDRDKFISDGLHAANSESASLPELTEYTRLEADMIKNVAAGPAAEWKKDMLDKIKNNNLREVFTNDNLLLLRRYGILNIDDEIQKNKKGGTYIDAYDLEKELEILQNEESREQDDLLKDFEEKWGIKPGESLFDDYIEKYPSNITAASENHASIAAAKYYGKDEITKKNIESYIIILNIYEELKNKTALAKNSPDDNIKQYFNRNIGHFANQIKSMVLDEKRMYKSAENDYNRKLRDTKDDAGKRLEECVNNVTIDRISPNIGIDYYSNSELSSIFLGTNTIKLSEEALDFKTTPNSKGELLNVKIMGFLEKYIYVCQDGKITLYDPFTLQQINEEKAVFDTQGKTVLFINNTEKNIIVVKSREKCEYKAIDTKESKGRIIFTFKDIKPEPTNKGVEK